MNGQDILSSLCAYDKRNPYAVETDSPEQEKYYKDKKENGDCFCDNCFTGRTQLAEYILIIKQGKNENT